MEQFKQTLQKILEISGLDFSLEINLSPEINKVSIFIYDKGIEEHCPYLIFDLEHLVRIIAKKLQIEKINVDLNNYKKERERIIAELARAAARKALLEKTEIILPAMNAYERRLIHVELASRPDVKTESVGEGIARRVVIRAL